MHCPRVFGIVRHHQKEGPSQREHQLHALGRPDSSELGSLSIHP